MKSLEGACADVASTAFRVYQNAQQIADKTTDDVNDIGSLLYAIADFEEARKAADGPLHERCKGASK